MFVVADRLAVGFIDQLIKLGIRVPEDISVVGYDDIRYSAYLKVPLTTVALPKFEIGRIAAEILFDRIQSSDPVHKWRQILLQPELVVRASSGQLSSGVTVGTFTGDERDGDY
jgi:LacI family transcriptional regulator